MTASGVGREPTVGQTIGPFFGFALPYAGGPDLASRHHPEAIRLSGRVLDGAGAAIPDALLEIWQPDPSGSVPTRGGSLHRDDWAFTGWGRAATDPQGRYSFTTLVPGSTAPGRASFLAMAVFARGLLDRLLTRVYLSDDEMLADDPLLGSLTPDRRDTLIATRTPEGYAFDVVLQGDDETVFLTHTAPPRR